VFINVGYNNKTTFGGFTMSLINERHIDTDRAGDTKGGGNYATLMDFLNRRRVDMAPFSENDIVVASAQFILINNTSVVGNLAVGTTSQETNGGVVAALLPGAVGTAATTIINDTLGNVTNIAEIRQATSHDPLLDGNGRRIYGLFQASSTAADGDAIAATGTENCQISFVSIDADGNLTLVAVNETIEIAVAKLTAERHIPNYYKTGSVAEADIIAPSSIPSEPVVRKYVVTAQYAADEVITVSTGAGAATGTSTVTGDTVASLGASAPEFNNDNRTRVRLNGDQLSKGTDAVWDSATTFHFAVVLDIGDDFEVEVAQ
jgi:hypothetical protein